jgi:RimJ/RimL family protein N-acetyltransferase
MPTAPSKILIRKAVESDATAMIAYLHALIAEANPYLPFRPGEESHYTEEDERQLLTKINASDNAIFLIALAGEKVVGVLNCFGGKFQASRHAATLGVSILKDHRNQGIGTQLVAAAIHWANQTKILQRLELYVYADNTPAIHLYHKFGFTPEGRRRNAFKREDSFVDDLLMALLL